MDNPSLGRKRGSEENDRERHSSRERLDMRGNSRTSMRAWLALAAAIVMSAAFPLTGAAVCQSSSGCEFWDANYHEYVLYKVDDTKVDVIVYPPASAYAYRDSTTARLAIQGWEDGIQALGATWFKTGIQINIYVVGQDLVIPADALEDPEISVVISEHNPVLLFGIGL